jgi:hypothetical protein
MFIVAVDYGARRFVALGQVIVGTLSQATDG